VAIPAMAVRLVFRALRRRQLKSRMSDIFKSHIWSFPVHVGLLLVVLMSGCKSVRTARERGYECRERCESASTSVSDGDTGSGRSRSRSGRADTQAAPGAFDFYLLNLPGLRNSVRPMKAVGVRTRLGFVVHGLWPQDASGDYPENCSDARGRESASLHGHHSNGKLGRTRVADPRHLFGLKADAYSRGSERVYRA